eukprot:Protomagalhaensia_sp_Gyna_25__2090@NODE_2124_length_1274_cov_593_144130_g1757_i0_p2_GENE_NODE_2124_length_1274_cov_593_144130_g1757_i0NODE_2124_length_1274_cov_593_144130_g1757_i0_p2_ORF_typecomplete_len156_score20_55NTF2/PF02136_20/6_1e21DUF3546/PF12066_8/0_0063SnoaL_2/PF12680_7/0_0071Mtr2/PF10429_9/0_025Terminase_GpA/PF05876_12/0_069_NODE_2124_length_1274_cov_593_144130_g1757_i08051221
MAVSPDQIATQFLEAYYAAFRADRTQMQRFYNEHSTLKWEKDEYRGPEAIGQCFQKISARTLDFPSIESAVQVTAGNGLLILVTGHVTIDGETPLGFSQVFVLLPAVGGSWYSEFGSFLTFSDLAAVHNEMFKFAFVS